MAREQLARDFLFYFPRRCLLLPVGNVNGSVVNGARELALTLKNVTRNSITFYVFIGRRSNDACPRRRSSRNNTRLREHERDARIVDFGLAVSLFAFKTVATSATFLFRCTTITAVNLHLFVYSLPRSIDRGRALPFLPFFLVSSFCRKFFFLCPL